MAKPSNTAARQSPSGFANNPFAKFASVSAPTAKLPSAQPAPAAVPDRRPQATRAPRLSMRHEAVGRNGRVVTRISGLPQDLLERVAARLRKALGCVAEVEGADVILAGSLRERATEWFQKIGDVRNLADEKPASAPSPARNETPPPDLVASSASGTYRRNIRPGARVGVVMKENQPTEELTQGVVRDLLTSSEEHPHGIKVRLVSGHVGRVKVIYA
jgi:uncharacterized repeat protein (TIGR03833 family)